MATGPWTSTSDLLACTPELGRLVAEPLMQLRKALKWSFLGELSSRLVQPLIFIAVARLLAPDDFGVMAAATMVLAFSQIFWEAGMGKALIQRQSDVEAAANVAFWINLALGVVLAIVLAGSAHYIANALFRDPRVSPVLQAMTVQILCAAAGSVQTALLQKSMGFKRLFWIRISTTTLPGLASIPLAINGMGYWALVGGALIGQVVQLALLWRMSSWRPAFSFDKGVAREMARFGGWVGTSGLLVWFYAWADALVIGSTLGSHDLGIYRTGNQFAAMIFSMLFAPVAPVLYSHLARVGHDADLMRSTAALVIRSVAYVAVPLGVVGFVVGRDVGELVFGLRWQGIGDVIALLTLMHAYAWLVGLNGEIYRAMGRPEAETYVTGGLLVVYLVVYLLAVQHGLLFFLWARVVLALAAVVVHLVVLQRILAVRVLEMVAHALVLTVAAATAVLIVDQIVQHLFPKGWMGLTLQIIGSVALSSLLMFSLRRGTLTRDLGRLRGRT